ncbi:WXG100 family type VII secretion target, partial [Streptomyces sp. NPDC054775]
MANEKDTSYDSGGFSQGGDGTVFADPGDLGSVQDYDTWDWKQIEAAINGMAAGVGSSGNKSHAASVSSPASLMEAANAFQEVEQVLYGVAGSLIAQANALAGPNGPWKGDAADSFLDVIKKMSNQVIANADKLSGGATGAHPVPQSLADNAVSLGNAQQLIHEIDVWYANQAIRLKVKPMSNGLIPISKKPELVRMMTDDMRKVLKSLANEYSVTIDNVPTPSAVNSPAGKQPDVPDVPDVPGDYPDVPGVGDSGFNSPASFDPNSPRVDSIGSGGVSPFSGSKGLGNPNANIADSGSGIPQSFGDFANNNSRVPNSGEPNGFSPDLGSALNSPGFGGGGIDPSANIADLNAGNSPDVAPFPGVGDIAANNPAGLGDSFSPESFPVGSGGLGSSGAVDPNSGLPGFDSASVPDPAAFPGSGDIGTSGPAGVGSGLGDGVLPSAFPGIPGSASRNSDAEQPGKLSGNSGLDGVIPKSFGGSLGVGDSSNVPGANIPKDLNLESPNPSSSPFPAGADVSGGVGANAGSGMPFMPGGMSPGAGG